MSETVRDVCAEMSDGEGGCYFPFTDNEIKVTKRVRHLLAAFADRIFAAHKREMAAKDAEIARLRKDRDYYREMYEALMKGGAK